MVFVWMAVKFKTKRQSNHHGLENLTYSFFPLAVFKTQIQQKNFLGTDLNVYTVIDKAQDTVCMYRYK